jgi:hypothetical protein
VVEKALGSLISRRCEGEDARATVRDLLRHITRLLEQEEAVVADERSERRRRGERDDLARLRRPSFAGLNV